MSNGGKEQKKTLEYGGEQNLRQYQAQGRQPSALTSWGKVSREDGGGNGRIVKENLKRFWTTSQ